MKQVLLSASMLALLVSCGEDAASDSNVDTTADSTAVTQDSLVDSVAVEESLSFEYFEDYAALNTKTKLYEHFDASQLKDDTTWYAEGTVMRLSTTLKDGDREVKFVWAEKDNETLENLDAYAQLWTEDWSSTTRQSIPSQCGISLGASLKEFVEWNGAAIHFSGFGWDYAGGVFELPEYGGKILDCETGIRLDMDYNDDSQDWTHLYGDMELNSDMDGMLEAPIFVGSFTYYLPSEETAE